MANKRMFSLTIIDSDAFLDMPSSAQNLYFHLSMRADDELEYKVFKRDYLKPVWKQLKIVSQMDKCSPNQTMLDFE
jgi:hypothetical protein